MFNEHYLYQGRHPKKQRFFSVFPKLGGTFLPKLILTLFGGSENKMKKIPKLLTDREGVIWSIPIRKGVFFWEVNSLIYAMNAHAHAWCLFTVAPFFRLFVFMNFCNCTTYCKVRIKISGFLTGGRSGGFLYSRRFLGLAIKCLLHCID